MSDLWLKRPLEELQEKIIHARHKKKTRSLDEQLKSGNDIQIASSEIQALEVINMNDDDIELISYGITNGKAGKLWHSPRLVKDGMLCRAIYCVYKNTVDKGSSVPEIGDKTEFLGFTEVHKDRNNQVTVFNITAMLLFTEKGGEIEIESAIVARDMGNSSIIERLIQCLQVLQICRQDPIRGTSKIKIKIRKNQPNLPDDTNYSNYHATIAYKLGFRAPTDKLDRHNNISSSLGMFNKIESNGNVIRMPKYTRKVAWIKHYNSIQLPCVESSKIKNQRKERLFLRCVKEAIRGLADKPANHTWKSSSRDYIASIESNINSNRSEISGDHNDQQ